MLLSTPPYFVFLAAVFFVFWLVGRYRTAGLAALLFANYFFYAKWDLAYLALIPLASTCDFLIGQALDGTERKGPRRILVTFSVAMNVALIASLKYMPFLVHKQWTLPLGVSFYAFQSMTYTIDIYRRDGSATSNYLAYLCSASFFPTTLAGPITRLGKLIPQIEKRRLLDPADGGRAFFLIGLGLTKKLLIADYLAENLINRVFDLPKLYSGTEALLAVYGYAFQLYNDFSGYTDIAIGSALLLGVRLPSNFNVPYAAENLADFWRRWHITLSNWLRDYLYFSLPGLRSKWKVFAYFNLVVTMTIGGLWHGASWNFVIWGVLHGIGLAAIRWVARGKKEPSNQAAFRWARTLFTFHFVAFAWIFFRASNLVTVREILGQIASMSVSFTNVSAGFATVLAIAAASHFVPKYWFESTQNLFVRSPSYVQAGALALLVVAIQYVSATGAAPFIYTRF